MAMEPVPVIEADLPCVGCQYNLRTSAVDRSCPECGLPVTHTLTRLMPIADAETRAWIGDAIRITLNSRYGRVAGEAMSSVDAVGFVWDAYLAAKSRGLAPRTAADLCEVVRDYAKLYFNDGAEAIELLAEWGIRRSEDIGRMVFAFVSAGWLAAEPHESVRDFDGLFELATWFLKDWG